MNTLTGTKIKDTFKALLKFGDNNVVSGALRQLSDGFGNVFPLFASTSAIKINNNTYPTSDGTDGQVMTTDGSGTIAFEDIPSQDPTMGGDVSGVASNAQIINNVVGIDQLNVTDGINGQVLTTDGSGTLSFSNSGTGDVFVSGTPVDNQLAVWTDASTVEGSSGATFDGSTLQVDGSVVKTYGGAITIGNGVTSTLFTGNGAGEVYDVSVVAGAGNGSNYEVGIALQHANAGVYTSLSSSGTLSISWSGNNVQLTNSAGSTLTYQWSALQKVRPA